MQPLTKIVLVWSIAIFPRDGVATRSMMKVQNLEVQFLLSISVFGSSESKLQFTKEKRFPF